MTYHANTQKTWGDVWTWLRDELASLTGWSIVYENFGDSNGYAPSNSNYGTEDTSTFHTGSSKDFDGDGDNENEQFVLQNPEGEYIEFHAGTYNGNDHVDMRYGTDFDTTGGEWVSSYPSGDFTRLMCQNNNNANTNFTDSVDAWLSYDATGWCLYVSRNTGDGYDDNMAIGQAKVNKLWDYTAATTSESEYCQLCLVPMRYGGPNGDSNGGTAVWGAMANQPEINYDVRTDTIQAEGALNPDGNYSDYIRREENLVKSGLYENGDNYQVVIGTHNRWLENQAHNDMAHGDTVQDGSGNDVYVILKDHYDESATDYNEFDLGMRIV